MEGKSRSKGTIPDVANVLHDVPPVVVLGDIDGGFEPPTAGDDDGVATGKLQVQSVPPVLVILLQKARSNQKNSVRLILYMTKYILSRHMHNSSTHAVGSLSNCP